MGAWENSYVLDHPSPVLLDRIKLVLQLGLVRDPVLPHSNRELLHRDKAVAICIHLRECLPKLLQLCRAHPKRDLQVECKGAVRWNASASNRVRLREKKQPSCPVPPCGEGERARKSVSIIIIINPYGQARRSLQLVLLSKVGQLGNDRAHHCILTRDAAPAAGGAAGAFADTAVDASDPVMASCLVCSVPLV